jgi:hypothetical protein
VFLTIVSLWTHKLTNSMFCIMLCIVPIPQVVPQATPHISAHHSVFLYLTPHCGYIVSSLSSMETIMWHFYCFFIIIPFMPPMWDNLSHLWVSWLHWIKVRSHSLLPLSCFYHILWFISEFSITIPYPLIVIIVLYAVYFPTLLFLLFLTFLVSTNFLA